MNSTRRSQIHRNLENRHLREIADHEICYSDLLVLNTLTVLLQKANVGKTPLIFSLYGPVKVPRCREAYLPANQFKCWLQKQDLC